MTEDNHLKGTVTKACNFGINVRAKNEYGSHDVLIWLLVFNEEDAPTITTEFLPNAYVNSKYLQYIEFTGYNQSFNESIEGPEWLISYKSGAYVVIEGTPTTSGNYTITVSIDNGAGIAKKTYSLSVIDETLAPVIKMDGFEINDEYSEINTSGINLVEGKAVNIQFFATGTNTSTNPLVWNLADGYTLPTGLSFRSDGLLSGTIGTGLVDSGKCKVFTCEFDVYNYNADGTTKQSTYKYIAFIVWKDQVITGIEVPSTEITVSKGGKRQLSATVMGYGDFDSTVDWSIGTVNSENTKIDENGLLTIGIDESVEEISVYARSKADDFYRATITVTVSNHSHEIAYVPAVKETCTKNGNIVHYVCESCGLRFADADATIEITNEEIVIAAHHTLGNLIDRVEPNCTTKGIIEHYDCSVCGHNFDKLEPHTRLFIYE